MGYLYVMEVPSLKCCKIGISEKSVDERKRSLQTGCPGKIDRIWQSRNIPDARLVEMLLHKRFEKDRTQGEWFKTPYMIIVEEADRMCKNGGDAEVISILEKENMKLKQQLEESYSGSDICNAILMLMKKAKEIRCE